jgi:microcompartment protein CcmK/EutM
MSASIEFVFNWIDMQLGRVVGCVWSTVKDSHLEGQRLLLVQPLTPELAPTGKRLVCADWTGAASYAFLPAEVPVDSTIVGIVDSIHLRRPEPC